MSVTKLDTQAALASINRCIDDDRVVVLCGAGISICSPAGLPSGRQVIETLRTELEWAWRRAGLPSCDFSFASDIVPEQLISAFHGVLGVEAMEFMTSFFNIRPNINHYALARCAQAGCFSDIITPNFDFGIESAALTDWSIPVVTEFPSASAEARTRQCRLHKIHGTLRIEDSEAARDVQFSTLQFTIERVGTALNERLANWLSSVLNDSVLFVIGYRGEDLDILPALMRQDRLRRVIWAYYPEPLHSSSPLAYAWLTKLGSRASVVATRAEDFLPQLAELQGIHVPSPTSGPGAAISARYLRSHPAATIVAAGHLVQELVPVGERERLLRGLFEHFERNESKLGKLPTRVEVMLAHLRASHHQDAGRIALATREYGRATGLLQRHHPGDEIALEVTLGQASCRYAFQQASVFKRPKPWTWRVSSFRGLFSLFAIAYLGRPRFKVGASEDTAARKLARYFIGDLWAAWAVLFDAVLAVGPVAQWLYRRAEACFAWATEPDGDWFPTQSFHQLRRDEAWLFANWRRLADRSRSESDPKLALELKAWDTRIAHYSYIQRVMGESIHLRLSTLLEAMRVHLAELHAGQAPRKGSKMLCDAANEYRRLGYRAGVIKAKTYKFVMEVSAERVGRGRWRRFKELLSLGEGVG